MHKCLETARTLLRPFQASDADAAFSWFSDPEVMQYIPFGPDKTVEDTAARIGRYMAHERDHGFSKWIIIEGSTGKPIGDAGFYHLPDGERVELGYRLAREAWGRGIATEVAAKWLEVARDFLEERTVYAFAHPENGASIKVMTRVGFTYSHDEVLYGMEEALYSRALDMAD